jgi:fucose permease
MGVVLSFAFMFGALAPVVLGVMKDRTGLGAGLMALAGFFLVGAVLIAVARTVFLKRDYEG